MIKAILAIALLPTFAWAGDRAAWPDLINDAALGAAIEEARSLSYPCEAELGVGAEGSSCATYRQATLKANTIIGNRTSWCLKQLDTPQDYPLVCSANPNRFAETRWPEIEPLSRKRNPEWWAKVDALNGQKTR